MCTILFVYKFHLYLLKIYCIHTILYKFLFMFFFQTFYFITPSCFSDEVNVRFEFMNKNRAGVTKKNEINEIKISS